MNLKNLQVTRCSSKNDFSGNSNLLPRSNFHGRGKKSSPQSHTAATLKRYGALNYLIK